MILQIFLNLVLVLALNLFVFSLREVFLGVSAAEVLERALLKEPSLQLKKEKLRVRELDLDRGDFALELYDAPYEIRTWTVNRYTGAMIPWSK